jgi:hypothetical protein
VTFRIEAVVKGGSDLGGLRHIRLKFFHPDSGFEIDPENADCRIGSKIRIRFQLISEISILKAKFG